MQARLNPPTAAVAAEVPRTARSGEIDWQPTDTDQTERTYRVRIGSGRLVLTELPLSAGQCVTVNAEMFMGELTVVLPPSAQVELDGSIGLGDLTIDKRVISGPSVKADETLAPLVAGDTCPPVIRLRIRARLADVVVTRAVR